MLGLSVTATLAANVAYGVPFGVAGALLSGWPAVAFIGSAEMAIGMVRRIRAPGGQRVASGQPSTPANRTRPKAKAGQVRRSQADTEAGVLSALATNPDMTHKELATAAGTSERTARRYRSRLATVNGQATDVAT